MKFLKRVRWDIIFFIFLLFISLFFYYLFSAYKQYKEYQKIVPQVTLNKDTMEHFFSNVLRREKIKIFAPKPLSDKETPLESFHITAKQKDINKLNQDLPKSGKEQYIKAYMKVDNKTYKVKLRYRGDGLYHWAFTQKSLRIKLSKKDIFHMAKKINLINPPSLINYRDEINYNLSKKLGLISPTCKPCRVFLNGQYMGVYLYQNQVDESLLREYKRMPGSIYYGDLHIDDLSKATDTNIWKKESFWQKKASRNAEQRLNREDIKLFIDKINNTDKKGFEEFVERYINKQKYFTFVAMDRAFGAFHHDYVHNHKIYFDPYLGKFEPIAWDLRFWSAIPQKDLSLYPLQIRLANNPKYDAKIDKITYNIISNNFIQDINNSYIKIIRRISRDLKSDIYRDIAIPVKKISPKHLSFVFEMQDLQKTYKREIKTLQARVNYLNKLYSNTKVFYKISPSKDKNRLEIVVDGESPAIINIDENLTDKIYLSDKKIHLKNKTTLYSGREIAKNSQKHFHPKLYGTDTVKSVPQKYIFYIPKDITDKDIQNYLHFTNYITSKQIEPKLLKKSFSYIKTATITYPKHKHKILSGKIVVDEDLHFDKYTTVTIKEGTTFLISKDKSIYFYGKVLALGTKQNPIKFIAKQKDKPWGAVVVQSEATSGSVFEYVEFEDGSKTTHNLIHYTAPFNIHDTKDFIVSHCTIGKNYKGDDSMHIAYSKGIVTETIFKDAKSDGLDIDISEVNVTNSLFLNSGNDGLDIMTTKLTAKNNLFINTGDKGISVGEMSDANITDSIFENCYIGLEIKDGSKAFANRLFFVNSKSKAINLYNKNRRYPLGGKLTAKDIYLYKNYKIKADKKSKYKIENLYKEKNQSLQKIRDELCKTCK